MTTLPPHMQRVQVELDELNVKCEALRVYINKGYPHAKEIEKVLHDNQYHYMCYYAKMLEERLSLYQPAKYSLEVIFAMATNKVFGQDGDIPWACKEDMKHFRETTANSVVIMGSKTFASLTRPLPNRTIIVISNKSHIEIVNLNPNVAFTCFDKTLTDALQYCKLLRFEKVFVIGGKELIREALPLADKIHISLIDVEPAINEDTVVLDFFESVTAGSQPSDFTVAMAGNVPVFKQGAVFHVKRFEPDSK